MGCCPREGKRRTTREQKFWIAVRVFLFCFCFCYFYLVRRLCFSHFITKILRSSQISVYRQNVPYNALLKVQLLHILEISTGPIKVADIFGWDKKLPKTFFQTVDDAIHYNCLSSGWRNWFSNTSRCRRDRARKKQSRDGIYFAIPNKRLEILTVFICSKYYRDAVRSISLVCSRQNTDVVRFILYQVC